MKYITMEERRKINALNSTGMYSVREIAERVERSPSTVSYVLRPGAKEKEMSAKTPLDRFHVMEKNVNQLKAPEEILKEPPRPGLLEMYLTAKSALDIYVASIGSEALDKTQAQESQV